MLAALWAAASPLSPVEVRAALGGELAYNTVHTILTRLVEKALVRRRLVDGRRVYAPVQDAADLAAERMRHELAASGDRLGVLRRFVTALSDGDERALRALLDRADQPTGEI